MSAEGDQFDSAPVDFGLGNAGKISCVFILDPDGYVLELAEYSQS